MTPSPPRKLASKLPDRIKSLPVPVIAVILLLAVINALIWASVGVVLHFHPGLTGAAVLSYTLGLRHALDADHISAIDLMTRRLIAAGQRPVTVGTWFSLGHSTIVLITCIVVAATSGALRKRFDGFQRVGNIIGTSVSAAVLLILCAGNAWVLWRLVGRLRAALREGDGIAGEGHRQRQEGLEGEQAAAPGEGQCNTRDDGGIQAARDLQLDGAGFLTRLLRKLFRIVDRPWKMYPIGVLFGLGFDTSSEIAVLGISSVQAAQGTSLWLILIFPILFTAAMCLVDTTDGAFMMALYTSKAFARDRVAILYYSIVLSGITVVVSAFIGIIQVLSLVQNVASPEGKFWDGLTAIGDNFEIVGASIVGVFIFAGVGSVLVYGPWRRRMERRSIIVSSDAPEEDAFRD
ncbi:NicO-domain-containing protein [Xylariaceae sp. FL0255]|nr:NicO-domain-containing protein [Xylariaceae sp. FL0255]